MAGGISNSTGLTSSEATELVSLAGLYKDQIGDAIANPAVWFGSHIGLYLEMLAVSALTEIHHNGKPDATAQRRDSMKAFESYLGRKPTGDDLITELSKVVNVPAPAAEAIRRDVARLTADG